MTNTLSYQQPDERGYYGKFGGAYIPEMLYPNVEELRTNYLSIIQSPGFKQEFEKLLKDYVGRPTPLYKADRLSELYRANIYLKREDLQVVRSYKLRGAYNLIQSLNEEQRNRGVVCASAAISAIVASVRRTKFGPASTPRPRSPAR